MIYHFIHRMQLLWLPVCFSAHKAPSQKGSFSQPDLGLVCSLMQSGHFFHSATQTLTGKKKKIRPIMREPKFKSKSPCLHCMSTVCPGTSQFSKKLQDCCRMYWTNSTDHDPAQQTGQDLCFKYNTEEHDGFSTQPRHISRWHRFFVNPKALIFFLFPHENVYCGYSSEAPHWGVSDDYPQYVFSWRNKKNIYVDIPLIYSYACDLYTQNATFYNNKYLQQIYQGC